jgi:acid phosphatase type 7
MDQTPPTLPAAHTIAPPLKITHGPCLQAPTETSMTIFWATDRNSASHVEYGVWPGPLDRIAVVTHHGLIDANTTLHAIPITGLKPGTTYAYRAASRGITEFRSHYVGFEPAVHGPESRFTTLDRNKSRFSFLTLNDRHDKVDLFAEDLANTNWDGIDLVFLNGDILGQVKSEEHVFTSLIDPCTKAFAQRIPFVFVRGNHETRGVFARYLHNYVPTGSPHFYRSFDHGPVHFTILDGGEDKNDNHIEYSGLVSFDAYVEEQTHWLRQEVVSEAFRRAPFRVIFLHILPQKMRKPDRIREQWLLDNWMPILNDAGVDLMLSGHTHVPAMLPITEGYRAFPIIVVGTEAVLRADVSPEYIEVKIADRTNPTCGLRVDCRREVEPRSCL